MVDERIKDYRKRLPINLKGEGMVFSSTDELFLAWAQKKVGTHARIRVRLPFWSHCPFAAVAVVTGWSRR